MCFFNDNRDNADNGLSATCTELGWRGKLYGFMDYAERENLQDPQDLCRASGKELFLRQPSSVHVALSPLSVLSLLS